MVNIRSFARPKFGPSAPQTIVRPVSQVSLTLSDQRAFPTAVREAVVWMNSSSRCAGAIPDPAYLGEPFDLTHTVGAMPAASTIFQDDNLRIWAGKLDFPDRKVGQRTWSTEICVLEQGQSTRFAARLTNITRAQNPIYSPSVPGLVRQVVGKLSAEADGFSISDEVPRIDDHTQADFEYLLHNKDRRLPIVAFSEDENGNTIFDPTLALARLVGAAHVVRLAPSVSWQMTRSLGRRYSVFGRSIRLYWPRFDSDNDDPFRHPLLTPGHYAEIEDYLDELARRVLPRAFAGLDADQHFLRFADIQALASRLNRSTGTKQGQTADLETVIADLKQTLVEVEAQQARDSEAAQALLDEASEASQLAQQERDELAEENDKLRAKILALSQFRKPKSSSEIPKLIDYEMLEQWAEENLGDNIEIKPRAIRESEKHGAIELIDKIQDTLLMIKEIYVPMRIKNETGSWEKFRSACSDIGIEESACFSQKGDIKNYPGYRTSIGSRNVYLDRHFKFGNGYDLRRMFRIYYTWDEDTKKVIIGHMPTHLDNNNTD